MLVDFYISNIYRDWHFYCYTLENTQSKQSMKQLFFISHDTQTAIKAGISAAGIPRVDRTQLTALNAFLTINHMKNIIPVWDDDDVFEEILDTYTFITNEDAEKSIYSKNNMVD